MSHAIENDRIDCSSSRQLKAGFAVASLQDLASRFAFENHAN